jgi:hypothetical protein
LRERFLACREAILRANEGRYGLEGGGKPYPQRLDGVIEAALARAEDILGLPHPAATGAPDPIDRIYGVRQYCWDRIFPEDAGLGTLSPLERSLRDLASGEAWHAARHMELADFAWYFHQPPAALLTINAAVEYVQNLYDFANRTCGGAFSTRRGIPPRSIRITAAEPINLTELLGRGGSRKALIGEVNAVLGGRL